MLVKNIHSAGVCLITSSRAWTVKAKADDLEKKFFNKSASSITVDSNFHKWTHRLTDVSRRKLGFSYARLLDCIFLGNGSSDLIAVFGK